MARKPYDLSYPDGFNSDGTPVTFLITTSDGIEHRYIEAQPDPRGDQLVTDTNPVSGGDFILGSTARPGSLTYSDHTTEPPEPSRW